MKKNIYLLFLISVLTLSGFKGQCAMYTITPSGFTFTPDSISVLLGDTISFALNPNHSAREVSQATWNANGSTSNGGFNLPTSGGMAVMTQVKTYYYVCGIHFSMGMKGRIFVTNPSGIRKQEPSLSGLEIFPNPAVGSTTVTSNVPGNRPATLKIYNAIGKCIFVRNEVSAYETMDLTKLIPGLYIVEISAGDASMKKRLIVTE